ncbi:MAG: YSC84-related protein, partial [Planctomycetota bacterium]|jgi:lipid-binding SYLF domain-containing protein
VLYEEGSPVGYCDLSQGSIGFQLGGQVYSELIFFETHTALLNFKSGEFAFAAQASAVAATAGAAANVDYDGGVAVFTQAKGGLMYEASIGGQKFTFEPK